MPSGKTLGTKKQQTKPRGFICVGLHEDSLVRECTGAEVTSQRTRLLQVVVARLVRIKRITFTDHSVAPEFKKR